MTYLNYNFLLPSFSADNLSSELVDGYFAAFPPAAQIVLDILCDGAEVDEDVPFSHNRLLSVMQARISSASVSEDNLILFLRAFEYIDFKYALIFFLELQEYFLADYLYDSMRKNGLNVFSERLNTFLSVLTTELIATDEHTLLS